MGNGYKSLLKATIVMSGAQIIEALMSIVRAKVIALLLVLLVLLSILSF